ncbi:MAG: hypothetical protein SNJ82_13785, partial [Gemmataceae bacterium]
MQTVDAPITWPKEALLALESDDLVIIERTPPDVDLCGIPVGDYRAEVCPVDALAHAQLAVRRLQLPSGLVDDIAGLIGSFGRQFNLDRVNLRVEVVNKT